MPGVYDDEKQDGISKEKLQGLEDSFAAPSSTESGSKKLQEQEELENNFAAPSATESGSDKLGDDSSDDDDSDDDDDSPGDNESNSKNEADKADRKSLLKKLATKKNAKRAGIGGLLGGTLFGGIFGLSTIVSGPGQLIQWGEDLKSIHMGASEQFQSDRSMRQWLYLLAGQNERGRLGIVGNNLADKWEKKLTSELGLKSVYSPVTRRLIGYEITDPYKAASFKEGLPTTKTVQGQMLDSSGTPFSEGGHEMIDLRQDPARTRRMFTKLAVKSIGSNRATSAIGYRLLKTRAGIKFHPWKNIVRDKVDNTIEKYQKKVDDQSVKDASGESNVGGVDTPEKKEARSKFTEIKGQLQEVIKTAKGPLIALMAVCALKQFANAIDAQNLNNMQTAERMGMEAVNGASQVQSMKDTNLDQLGVYAAKLYDPVTKTSVTDDPGVQEALGDKPTGFDYISKVKPTAENQKPWWLDAVQKIPTDLSGAAPGALAFAGLSGQKLPTADICTLITDVSKAITNIPVIKQVMEAVSWMLDHVILKPLTGKTAKELIQAGIDYFATGAVDILARGAERGGLQNMGVRRATNDQMLALGGRTLSPDEEKGVETSAMNEQKQEFANSSLYNRYLNIHQAGSAIGQLAMALPTSKAQFFATIQQLPARMADMLSKSFGLGKAFAADQGTYDYGFPLIGFSLSEQNDPKYDNPFDNEAYMLQGDRLQRMNSQYGQDCFYMTVNDDGTLHNYPSGDIANRPSKCDDKSNEELTHYRFYLADLVTADSNACYEGDEDSCNQVGMGKAAASTDTTGAPDIGDPFAASDTMTCSAGTDGGVQDGYHGGTLVKIRICNVNTGVSGATVQVNARIASNVDKLYKDAAAQGVAMGGTGFRTMAGQVSARQNNNCPDIYKAPADSCHPPTAIPGFSNHQMGEAIDFSVPGGGTISSGSSYFNWLKANAAKYGLANLPTEAWHWSVDGN